MEEKILEIVTGIQQQLIVMQEDINTLKQDVAELKQDVSELKQDVAELKQDVTGLKEDVVELQQDVSGLKQDVSNLKQDVEYLKKQRIQDRKEIMEAFYNLEINIQRAIDDATKPNKEAIEYNAKINSLDHENYDSRIRKLEFVSNTCKN